MTKYITKSQLKSFQPAAQELREQFSRRRMVLAGIGVSHGIFLSRSHKDYDLVLSTKAFLEKMGFDVFVDWLDDGMPERTSSETASVIKAKIEHHNKFALLVTNNSKESKWVPWELGFADKARGLENILIIPVSDDDKEFQGVEYLGLYYSLEFYNNEWVVWRADPPALQRIDRWLKS